MAIAASLGSGDLEEVRRALEELSELDDTVEIAAHAGAAVAHLGPERDVCLAALDVLDRLEPSAVALHAEAMLARLEATDAGLRYRVVEVLATLEPAALELVAPSVHAWVAHRDEGVRRRAVELLGKLEPAALARSMEHILPALDDEDDDVRLVATEALCKLLTLTLPLTLTLTLNLPLAELNPNPNPNRRCASSPPRSSLLGLSSCR